jgi:hypothetical protein
MGGTAFVARATARVVLLVTVGFSGTAVLMSTIVQGEPAVPALGLHPNHMVGKPGVGKDASIAAIGWASTNWSGYAVSAAPSSRFTSVSAQWKVPAVRSTQRASYSAAWVGIDGFTNSFLIQTGTEQDYYSGGGHYSAWWTTSAQNFLEQRIQKPVASGDPIVATIAGVGTSWTMTIADRSSVHPWTFTQGPITYTGPGSSAEWILEAPTVGGRVGTLAHYSSPTTFDPGTANGTTPNLQPSEAGELVQGRSQIVSVPSTPDVERDGFNISYGSSAPSPPAS